MNYGSSFGRLSSPMKGLVKKSFMKELNFLSDTPPADISCVRSGVAYDIIQDTLISYPANTARTSSVKGLLVEEKRTNYVRNSVFSGAVSGTPGTLPTNMSVANTGGLTRQIVGTGTENGIPYIDLRYTGTATINNADFMFEAPNSIVAAVGEIFNCSYYVKLLTSADLSGLQSITTLLVEYDSASGFLVSSASGAAMPTTSYQRYFSSKTMANASVAYVSGRMKINLIIGGTVDFTIRVAAPQIEKGRGTTSFILTSGSAVTREVDLVTLSDVSYLNPVEGTFQVEATLCDNYNSSASVATRFFEINAGDSSNYLALRRTLTSGTINLFSTVSGSNETNIQTSGSSSLGSTVKVSASYNSGKGFLAYSGENIEDTTSSGTFAMTSLRFGARTSTDLNGGNLNGYIKTFRYWNKRRSNWFVNLMSN